MGAVAARGPVERIIHRQALQIEWLSRCLVGEVSKARRMQLVSAHQAVALADQCRLLRIARQSAYHGARDQSGKRRDERGKMGAPDPEGEPGA